MTEKVAKDPRGTRQVSQLVRPFDTAQEEHLPEEGGGHSRLCSGESRWLIENPG